MKITLDWISAVGIAVLVAAWATGVPAAPLRYAEDAFVRMIERQQGMFPGSVRIIPDCGCTIRYVGTRRDGNHYHVDIDKLD